MTPDFTRRDPSDPGASESGGGAPLDASSLRERLRGAGPRRVADLAVWRAETAARIRALQARAGAESGPASFWSPRPRRARSPE